MRIVAQIRLATQTLAPRIAQICAQGVFYNAHRLAEIRRMLTSAANPHSASTLESKDAAIRWEASPREFAQLRSGPVLCRIDELGVLQLEGPDSESFLQSQSTADIAAMSLTSWQLAGYCTAKGRLLAIFEAWRWHEGLRLLLPGDLLKANLDRLSKFVLRAKVRLSDVSASWAILGICGPGSAETLMHSGVPVPDQPWQCHEIEEDGRVARVPSGPGCPERLLLLVPAERLDVWLRRLPSVAQVDKAVWWWTQVDAAIPAVFEATRELFLPQAVNLEVLGGVSFRKGCYPGQEVVARSQYRGKLRRRLGLAHVAQLGAGSDIFHSIEAEPVGRVVLAARGPQGGWDVLFECPTELTEYGSLHAGSRDAPPLVLRALPYRIFDPTA